MAIAFVANALGATNSTTSFSITLPTTAANDIIILEFTHRGVGDGTIGGTSVTTGGLTYTLKKSQLYASSAFSGKTYWTRATGNHAGQTVTGSSLTNSCAAIVTTYSGAVTSGDPLADATIVGEENASGNETQAEISTATAGAYVVLVVANSPDVAVSTQACTSPGTLIERAERLSTGGTDTSVSHASEAKASAGATGAFTWAQTDGASGSWAYAIKPFVDPVVSGAGTSTGSASTTGTGRSTAVTSGVSTGLAAVAGTAVAFANTTGVSAGTASVVGASPSSTISETTGVSTATATVVGAGVAIGTAAGAAAGLAVVSGKAVAIAETVGMNSNISTAVGVGEAVGGGTSPSKAAPVGGINRHTRDRFIRQAPQRSRAVFAEPKKRQKREIAKAAGILAGVWSDAPVKSVPTIKQMQVEFVPLEFDEEDDLEALL